MSVGGVVGGAHAGGPLGLDDARRLQACVERGGVAVFPSDTVYGICCDPENEQAARRLYELKGRAPTRAAAVMFFTLEPALRALPELTGAERAALHALLPGPVTLLLPNRGGRFAAACATRRGTRQPTVLGLRVPRLSDPIQALGSISVAVMQSSANISGDPDARRLRDVPTRLLDGADVALDGGELPGAPSTVVDLRDYHATGAWTLRREGAMTLSEVGRALGQAL